jgi:hypothetical protein
MKQGCDSAGAKREVSQKLLAIWKQSFASFRDAWARLWFMGNAIFVDRVWRDLATLGTC